LKLSLELLLNRLAGFSGMEATAASFPSRRLKEAFKILSTPDWRNPNSPRSGGCNLQASGEAWLSFRN
jgi:hypothetical protein